MRLPARRWRLRTGGDRGVGGGRGLNDVGRPLGEGYGGPAGDNCTDGKAQNRRVAVNVLVSKSADGL
jgi:hypothetical protein